MIYNWVKKYQELGYNDLTTKQGRSRKMKDKNIKQKIVNNSDKLDDKDKLIFTQLRHLIELILIKQLKI